ncbi:MAG: pantoate--beta-alanine ligase [Gammaproteobacteria bacterium]|nr:pantoate--beta-alanine ligase [Gammaproteobacteria bacterium]
MTKILKTRKDLNDFKHSLGSNDIGFVPTMGNLHAGHISLIKIAKKHSKHVIVSIFVNPTQFGENEDLNTYPRTFEADFEKMQSEGVDAVFFPDVATIYPHGNESTLSIHLPCEMTNILCGIDRPTHFQGVATVVAKLLLLIKPNIAVFGEKDYQQLAIIKRLVAELFIDTSIIAGDIVREDSGLAMSSRNQYLSLSERKQAYELSKTLSWCKSQLLSNTSIEDVLNCGKEMLTNVGVGVEYLELRDTETLASRPSLEKGILLVAAKVGTTRLIDNLRIKKSI